MHFLVSNDDGVHATGIRTLAEALKSLGKVSIYAPEQDRSGASNSLTLTAPLRIKKIEPDRYAVNGTPTDCVHMALTGLMDSTPDMVISGINNAANLGDDTLYSGTVAAAIEGRFLGLPAIAISLATNHSSGQKRYFETAQVYIKKIIQNIQKHPLSKETILNVNVPNVPVEQVKGVKITRLGNRHQAENTVEDQDPRGRRIFWIGPAGPEADAGEGTDFHAIKHGFVSITPLKIDMTHFDMIDSLKTWSSEI